MENVFVPEYNRLAKADDFTSGANKALEHSRMGVAWAAAGVAIGAYEAALRYSLNRKQFGKPIARFQATQLKLSKMLGLCEMMLGQCLRVS